MEEDEKKKFSGYSQSHLSCQRIKADRNVQYLNWLVGAFASQVGDDGLLGGHIFDLVSPFPCAIFLSVRTCMAPYLSMGWWFGGGPSLYFSPLSAGMEERERMGKKTCGALP